MKGHRTKGTFVQNKDEKGKIKNVELRTFLWDNPELRKAFKSALQRRSQKLEKPHQK